MEKGFGDWLSGLIITLASMAGGYGIAIAFIKNTGIKKKKLEKLERENAEMREEIASTKRDIVELHEEIKDLKSRCTTNEKNTHDFMMFQLGRK